ncbi:serine/threonine protein kinase [Stigmatella aurantiaca]|uniref:Protein kinase n=1 Tax=Stigmatella aurantiaca (strain DW4/3-1) TaxID=378806 RepID=E3FIK2_STIAD|nr:serine/threonine-protein kinase [Stigmatella aurantiaca]ADO75349.1 Protein kinase [Stigmatella aurantiaca DW4/3-1]
MNPPPEPSRLPPGTEVGSWRVLERIGHGTYGTVYRVEPLGHIGAQPLALKLALHRADPRFEREAVLLSRLAHPHVPSLHGQGLWAHPSGPFPFLVMDWAGGIPLYAWALAHSPSSRQVLSVLAQVAHALAALHAVGGVHRDVKGDNILVRPSDFHATLIDFGAGSFHGARPLTEELLPPGTPPYRSPEALEFRWRFWFQHGMHYAPAPADDVYALGVTAYRLLTGTYPSSHPKHPPAETLATFSPELAKLLRRMLSRKPSARGLMDEVARALQIAAERAGPEADRSILRRPQPSPGPARHRRPPARSSGSRRTWVGVAVGLGASFALQAGWAAWRHAQEGAGMGWAWPALDPAREDTGNTGLAKEALPDNAVPHPPESAWARISLEFPKRPLPSQARPPCKKREAELNGGCWIRPADATPPCGDRYYEWKGLCYFPVLAPPPPATSAPSLKHPSE